MHWLPDPSAGTWLRERLDDPWNSSMHSVVPHGYPAYARILHPAIVRSLPDRPVPSGDDWNRMPEADRLRMMELFVDEPATWAETARAFGTVLHPLAQWQSLVRTAPGQDWQTRIAPDGREFSAPAIGALSAETVAAIAAHLRTATTTPVAGVAALWEGFGGLLGHFGHTPSRAFLTVSDDPHHRAMLGRSMHNPFNDVFRRKTWQEGILSREISQGPRFQTRDRAYVLFSAGVDEFADPDWVLRAPWRDRPGEEHGFPPSAQSPSILWPEDLSWVMVSEIDFDSTVVAGSAELISALCADPTLEAFQIGEGAELHDDADEMNR